MAITIAADVCVMFCSNAMEQGGGLGWEKCKSSGDCPAKLPSVKSTLETQLSEMVCRSEEIKEQTTA